MIKHEEEEIVDPLKQASFLLNCLDNSINEDDMILLKAFPPSTNRNGQEVQSIKVSFKDRTKKNHLMQNKHTKIKDLPQSHILKNIFIKSDQPTLTRKENDRLRQKAVNLREQTWAVMSR